MTTAPGPATGPGAAAGADPGEPGERDPGLARERTTLAWIRTAISFAAVGGVVLRHEVFAGLLVLGLTPLVWYLGQMAHNRPGRLRLMSAAIVAVAVVALVVSFIS
jgi:uncharacterized membrane protein YidH (DUF202 family)